MKGNKKAAFLTRKAKIKKEDLSGWSQDEGTPLQEEIGIDTWFEDRKRSGRERGYVCSLVESFERQEQARRFKIRNSSRKSQRQSGKSTRNNSANHNLAIDDEHIQGSLPGDVNTSMNDTGHVIPESTDPIGSLTDHVTVNQSEHKEVDWKRQFVVHPSQDISETQHKVESPPENLAVVNLARYEERLRKQREKRLRKSMDIIKNTADQAATVSSSKKAANITSVTFAEGMIRPVSDLDNTAKKPTHKNISKTKLPSISNGHAQSSNEKVQPTRCGLEKNSTKTTENTNHFAKKFNFDILEKYALIRNSKHTKSKATFTDYVEKMRTLRASKGASHNQSDDFDAEIAQCRSPKKVDGDNQTFDEVRELWYESRRDRIVGKGTRRTRSLPPSHRNGKMLVVDAKRSRCMSEPANNEDNVPVFEGKVDSKKIKCPLQRMLSATNRRIEANKIQKSKKEKYVGTKLGNESIDMKRTPNGIQCCVVGRSSPSTNPALQ